MKTRIQFLSIAILLFTAACSSSYQASNVNDDIYYNPSRVQETAQEKEAIQVEAVAVEVETDQNKMAGSDFGNQNTDEYAYQEQPYYDEYAEGEVYYDGEGNTIINNNYYDYAYSSRIRRFHRNFATFGYYDPFFTNMYWYNYDPFYYGVSLYHGYGASPFFYPGYWNTLAWDPFFSWNMGFGWGWSPYSYGWGFGAPYHGFGYGYNQGFFLGYNAGYWGRPFWEYHYNSFDPNNYYYGHRGSVGGSTAQGSRGTSGREVSTKNNPTFAEIYENSDKRRTRAGNSMISDNQKRERLNNQQNGSRLSGERGVLVAGTDPENNNNRNTNAVNEQKKPARESSNTQTRQPRATERYSPVATPEEYRNPVRNQSNTRGQRPVYDRPENTTRSSRAPRTYTPPVDRQPRSNQEYRRPAADQRPVRVDERQGQRNSPQARPSTPARVRPDATRPTQTRPAENRPVRPQVAPRPTQTRPEATPQRRPTQRATPARTPSSRPAVAPQRAPQRSTPRYSPSRSSGSSRSSGVRSSSPSRSSGSVRSSSPSRSSGSSSRSSGSSRSGSSGRNR